METFGWNPVLADLLRQLHPGCDAGRVATENRGIVTLWTASGELQTKLPAAWPDPAPVTGDWVAFEPHTRRLQGLLPRRTAVARKRAGRATIEQVLAANVDVLFLVNALDHDFNSRRIERYLLAAHRSGAEPVIVLNKSDLCDDPLPVLTAVDQVAPGVPVVLLSARHANGLTALHQYVEPGQTAVLLGSSGVGKSTIVNQLLQTQTQSTLPVREHDSRGRHSTTARQLFLLPQGWLLIDTPGLREFEPWAATAADLHEAFADIADLAQQCRFRDCRHHGEPGCAVVGSIAPDRLASLHKLEREQAAQTRMHDVHAAREHKRKWKAIHKAMRDHQR